MLSAVSHYHLHSMTTASLDTGDGRGTSHHAPELLKLLHNYLDLPLTHEGPTIETCQQTEMGGR